MDDRKDVTKDDHGQARGDIVEGEVPSDDDTKTVEKSAGNATMGGCAVKIG